MTRNSFFLQWRLQTARVGGPEILEGEVWGTGVPQRGLGAEHQSRVWGMKHFA